MPARPSTRVWSPRSIRIHMPIRPGCSRTRSPWSSLSTRSRIPHNLGAVIRAAEVAGASGVVIPERRAAEVTPAVCKASAGAVEHLAVARVRNLADWLASAKESGAWIYGADEDAKTPYTEVDWRGRAVLAMGSEGRGLRPRVAAACDELISIPVRGRSTRSTSRSPRP